MNKTKVGMLIVNTGLNKIKPKSIKLKTQVNM